MQKGFLCSLSGGSVPAMSHLVLNGGYRRHNREYECMYLTWLPVSESYLSLFMYHRLCASFLPASHGVVRGEDSE